MQKITLMNVYDDLERKTNKTLVNYLQRQRKLLIHTVLIQNFYFQQINKMGEENNDCVSGAAGF